MGYYEDRYLEAQDEIRRLEEELVNTGEYAANLENQLEEAQRLPLFIDGGFKARAVDAERRLEVLQKRLDYAAGPPINPEDIKQFQKVESHITMRSGVEVFRRGVVTRISKSSAGHYTFWSGMDYLGGDVPYAGDITTYRLLEEAPREEPE